MRHPHSIAPLVVGGLAALVATPVAHAQQHGWNCVRGDGQVCTETDLADPQLRHILVLSAGYPDGSAESFRRDVELLVDRLGNPQTAQDAWSVQKRGRILYIAFFTGGGPLGSDATAFDARIVADPVGVPTLAARHDAVHRFVDEQQARMPSLRPLAVAVLAQSDATVAPHAAPPAFSSRDYGIALFTTDHLKLGSYVPTHELAHAALNFLDEYVETGLESIDLGIVDVLTPRLVLPSHAPPGYDYRLSEILAANGPSNLAVRPDVTTVETPGTDRERFEYEGGLFFGRGTWHDAGGNLMNSNRVQRGPGDGFAFAHSPSQQAVIATVFGDAAPRANDRLRTAGPVNGWVTVGPTANLLLYDGDKRNSWHPTRSYEVQVGWFERRDGGSFSWRLQSFTVTPVQRTVDLALRGDNPIEWLLLAAACRAGATELSSELHGTEVCDGQRAAFLPVLRFYVPYEEVTVPTGQPFTAYFWRFRTSNGSRTSGWTGWSSFYRSF
jgi:hypothetical protein